jgi:hypothetical protein
MSRAIAVAFSALVLAFACKGPTVPSPLTGQSRYLCCNMHYDKTEITDVNYLQGANVPLGTQVQILEVKKNSVKFQPAGHPALTLSFRHGRKMMTFEQYLDRIFLTEDPRAKLPKPPRDRKQAAAVEKVRKAIEEGVIEPGMTKEQVLMAVGYPPAHRTPSLESSVWTYWTNRWSTYQVYFDGDRVSRLSR